MRTLPRQVLQILTKEQRSQLVRSCVAGFFNAGLEWVSLAAVIPIFYQLINSGNQVIFYPKIFGNLSTSVLFIVIVAVFALKTFLSTWLANKQLQVTNKIYIDLSRTLYERYFQQDYVTHARVSYADAFRKIKYTAFDFSNHVVHGFLVLLADLSICIITTALMVWVDYRIVIAMMALGAPTLLFYYFFKKYWVKKIDESFRKFTPEANLVLTQGIESYSEARIYHSESYFINAFLDISSKTSNLLGKLKILSAFPARIMEVIGIVCFVFVVFFGAGTLSSSDTILMLGLFSLAIYRIMPSFNRILASITQIQSYSYSVEEIRNIAKLSARQSTTSNSRLVFEKSIQLRGLTFSYERSQHELVNNLSATIGKGEFVILTGPSGSGKTTLIHLLSGLIKPTQGDIVIDQHILTDATISQWQNTLGYVPQSGVIFNDSILNNILFVKASPVNHNHLQRAIDVSGLTQLINELPDGVMTQVGEHGMSLSGGQRQRLILARAIYRDPDILLLDEVTNQLDEKAKLDILTRLKSLTKNGKTIILSSHDPLVKTFATSEIRLGRNIQTTTSVFQ